ncbi:MAG TPA: hypothetical protein VF821_14000 [Lentzea sp.]
MLPSAFAGVLPGALGAFAYSRNWLSPISHTLGLWLHLLVVVCTRATPRQAVPASTRALSGAVLTSHLGEDIWQSTRFPQPFSLNPGHEVLFT